jgi:hypothetical protein
MLCESVIRLKSFNTPDVFANERAMFRMARLVLCETTIRLKSFVAPNVRTLPLPNIQMPFLVYRQRTLHFERFFALLARLRVNMVAYKVKDAPVCEVVMQSKLRSAFERPRTFGV